MSKLLFPAFNNAPKHISEVGKRPHPLGLKRTVLVHLKYVQKPLNAFNLQEVESKHHCVTAMTH